MIERISRSGLAMLLLLLGPATYWEHSIVDRVHEQETSSPSTMIKGHIR